jgi:pantoate--beta-alanine ligase
MQIVTTILELHTALSRLPRPIGLVPTMGYLHDGHLSLVHRAYTECASVIATIFVNPTQFSPDEDLDAYPRDIPRDFQLLREAGTDLVWTPTPEVMYPKDYQTWVEVTEVTQPLEGVHRPEHFRGVTTVVSKLFNATQPDKAYFGQKDAQQVVVIQQMTDDLNFPVEIVVCQTVREEDGLAMSSRNSYLNPKQRQAARVLFRALSKAKEAFESGERDAEALRRMMARVIGTEPLARLHYVSCSHPYSLRELESVENRALLSLAVFLGKTRLIDNLVVGN